MIMKNLVIMRRSLCGKDGRGKDIRIKKVGSCR